MEKPLSNQENIKEQVTAAERNLHDTAAEVLMGGGLVGSLAGLTPPILKAFSKCESALQAMLPHEVVSKLVELGSNVDTEAVIHSTEIAGISTVAMYAGIVYSIVNRSKKPISR